MWYLNNKVKTIDYNKPIVAFIDCVPTYLLLPIVLLKNLEYVVIGVRWFNIEKGQYDETSWDSIEQAISYYHRKYSNIEIKNVKMEFTEI